MPTFLFSVHNIHIKIPGIFSEYSAETIKFQSGKNTQNSLEDKQWTVSKIMGKKD